MAVTTNDECGRIPHIVQDEHPVVTDAEVLDFLQLIPYTLGDDGVALFVEVDVDPVLSTSRIAVMKRYLQDAAPLGRMMNA
jgi:hypothetical protein